MEPPEPGEIPERGTVIPSPAQLTTFPARRKLKQLRLEKDFLLHFESCTSSIVVAYVKLGVAKLTKGSMNICANYDYTVSKDPSRISS